MSGLTTNATMWNTIHTISHQALHKAYSLLGSCLQYWGERKGACAVRTYSKGQSGESLARYVAPVGIESIAKHRQTIAAISDLHLKHQFDLLGSGWVEVRHGMKCRGFEGYRFPPGPAVRPDKEGRWLIGRINPGNLSEAQRIWKQMAMGHGATEGRSDYIPLDWQLDFKSGFRWSERTWYQDIEYGNVLGADVKVPWELGRMQHVIQFAWAYALGRAGYSGFQEPEVYVREFRHQVLDFIATNPPGFGVQWKCTMDVAIRVSNWLIAYDLFRAFDVMFDDAFEDILMRSVYEHGRHIVQNLEWSARLRHNHYLADIVGLLFVAAYLPSTPQINTWLGFAVEELIHEVRTQFHAEGSNFEGSTCYHRLSAEMTVYATALILALPEDRLRAARVRSAWRVFHHMGMLPSLVRLYRMSQPDDRYRRKSPLSQLLPCWYLRRLERMAEFTIDVTKPSGYVAQFGDNDNGRFLKVLPEYRRMKTGEARRRFANLVNWTTDEEVGSYWWEDPLCHRHLVAATNGLFSRTDFASFYGDADLDKILIEALAGNSVEVCHSSQAERATMETMMVNQGRDLDTLQGELRKSGRYEERIAFVGPSDLMVDRPPLTYELKIYAYPEFGLYVFRSSRLFLAIRCGPRGRNGQGGHDHNDQLSIELSIDGVDWVSDPGTYVYSALPERRNQYRSVHAHFTPHVSGREPAPLDQGLFVLPDHTRAKTIYVGPEGFAGMHNGYGEPVYRLVSVDDFRVTVIDYVPRKILDVKRALRVVQIPVGFSPGYGVLVSSFGLGSLDDPLVVNGAGDRRWK